MALGDAWRGVTDKFYSLCEWLEARGVPAISKFVEPLEDRGIPSLPAAMAIFLVLAIGLGLVAVIFLQPQPVSFRIKVLSGEQNAEGAVVEVYDNGVFVASATTENGIAVLPNLPKKKLQFKIIHQGTTVTREVDANQRTATTVQLSEAAAGSGTSTSTQILAVNANSSAPVKDARVFYDFLGNKGSVNTDAKGNARIPAPSGTEVSVRVTHPSYRQTSFTFVASAQQQVVRMEPKASTVLFAPAETALVVVSAVGPLGEPLDGEARLYDSFSLSKISSAPLEGGIAFLENGTVGSLAYVMVESPGFVPYDGSLDPFTIEESNDIAITMQEATAENSGETAVKTVDDAGAPIAARVFLLSADTNAVLSEQESQGEVSFQVASGVQFYAAAVATGRVPARSAWFEAGQSATLALPAADDSNSANLSVVATIRDGTPVPFTAVMLSTTDGSFVVPQAETDYNGFAEFANLQLGEAYLLKAVYSDSSLGTMEGSAMVVLDANATVSLVLDAPDAALNAYSYDFANGKPLAANVTAYYPAPDDAFPYSSCYGTACSLPVKSGAESQVAARAAGYADAWMAETLGVGEEKNETFSLVPNALIKGVSVQLLNVTDFYGKPVANAMPEKTYTAKFLVASENAVDWVGFYLRIGTKALVGDEIAAIEDGGYPAAGSVAKSISFNPGADCSGDLGNFNAKDGLVKWVELKWKGGGSRVVEVKFKVSAKARTGDSVVFSFRAYAMKGGKWTRMPEDSEMGFESNSTAKAGCYARTEDQSLPVITPLSAEIPEMPGAEFTQSATVSFDPERNKVVSSVDEFALQVDTFFPYDAMPLAYSDADMLVELKSSVAGDGSTKGCYSIESQGGTRYLVFKPKEANPECPIGVEGNQIKGDDTASAVFTYSKGPTMKVEVPIILKASSLPAVFVKPDELTAGDHSAKLIYLVNQKQTQRVVKAAVEGTVKEFPLDQGVKALAWRGPGTLSFSAEGSDLWEQNYQQVQSYFSGMGDLGLTLRKACNDYLCCANGWCSQDAARTAFGLFRDQAKALAASTAFRRGGGQPMAYFFPDKPFSMSMVAQLRESTSAASLGEGITFNEESAGQCLAGNPGVYEIRATGTAAGAWTYSASIVPLFKVNYVTDACDRSQYYYRSTPQGGEYVPLCDFLFGDANCVRPVNHAVTTAESQANETHQQPVLIPSAFWGIHLIAGPECETLSAAFVLKRKATDAAFEAVVKGYQTSFPPLCTKVGIATATACSPVSEALVGYQKAYDEYKACLKNVTIDACNSKFLADAKVKVFDGEVNACHKVAVACAEVPKTTAVCTPCVTALNELGSSINPASLVTVFSTKLAEELAAGKACDKGFVKAGVFEPKSWDSYLPFVPAVMLPRGAWMTCYAYDDGCHKVCSKRNANVVILPYQNQKFYFLHVGLTKSCSPNPIGLSVITAAINYIAFDMMHVNLGKYGSIATTVVGGVIGLMDAVADPLFPGGPDDEEIPPKGAESKASDASAGSLEDSVEKFLKSDGQKVMKDAVNSKGDPGAAAGAARQP